MSRCHTDEFYGPYGPNTFVDSMHCVLHSDQHIIRDPNGCLIFLVSRLLPPKKPKPSRRRHRWPEEEPPPPVLEQLLERYHNWDALLTDLDRLSQRLATDPPT